MEYFSIIISIFAIGLSLYTFWFSKIKKGKVKMTRPTAIYFGPDGPNKIDNKVYIRTLLFSTSEKGNYIQNMFIRLQRSETVQNFNIWVYNDNGLTRGSGLYIDKNGKACDHHFLMPKDGSKFDFLSGEYILQIYVEPINESPKEIFRETLFISKNEEEELKTNNFGIYYDWAPNSQKYLSHIKKDSGNNQDFESLAKKFMEGYDKP